MRYISWTVKNIWFTSLFRSTIQLKKDIKKRGERQIKRRDTSYANNTRLFSARSRDTSTPVSELMIIPNTRNYLRRPIDK